MDKLKAEVRWFIRNCGGVARPFMRHYLNPTIQECLKTHTEKEVDDAIVEATRNAEAELDAFLV